jgi:Rieske Fe-S protein
VVGNHFMGDSIQRRSFIRTFALGTAFSTVFGKVWQASVLADITPSNVGLLRVKLSDFPALLDDYSSVRIGINPIDNPFGPVGDFYPILVNHTEGNAYYALDCGCRHAGCIVPPYDRDVGAIVCPCHGSAYWIDGSLLGGPATSPLFTYPIHLEGNDTLIVEIPNLGYRVNSSLVQNVSQPRLRLDFSARYSIKYEVVFREKVTDPWTNVLFALTQNGPADQASITGDTYPDSPQSVFVNRTTATGFYSVEIKLIDMTNGDGTE